MTRQRYDVTYWLRHTCHPETRQPSSSSDPLLNNLYHNHAKWPNSPKRKAKPFHTV